MKLGFAHRALQPEQQAIIEEGRMIDAVGISNQSVGEAGKIDEPVPIRIVAGKTRDFETEHEADAGKRHLGC